MGFEVVTEENRFPNVEEVHLEAVQKMLKCERATTHESNDEVFIEIYGVIMTLSNNEQGPGQIRGDYSVERQISPTQALRCHPDSLTNSKPW